MEYAWDMHGINVEYACNMYETCMDYHWHMHGNRMDYVLNMHGMCMEYSICMEHVWHILHIYIYIYRERERDQRVWNNYEICMAYI